MTTNLQYLPVLPGRLEFAAAIRHALLRSRPEVVAVELPMSLEHVYLQAIERLPEISVILYEGESEDQLIYVPVEPADPFTEAVRTAREMDAELVFIEPDLSPKPHVTDFAPDPYAVRPSAMSAISSCIAPTRSRAIRVSTRTRRLWRGDYREPTRAVGPPLFCR